MTYKYLKNDPILFDFLVDKGITAMKSVTQQPISKELVNSIVQHHFGKDTPIGLITELAEGWYSIAYSVELLEYDFDIVIKLDIPDKSHTMIYEHKCLETEVRSMELVQKHELGRDIPLPEIMGYDLEGRLIGRGYLITKKFLGSPLNTIAKKIPKQELAALETKIGQLQTRLAQIAGTHFTYFYDHPQHPVVSSSWAETFSLMMKNLFQDASDIKINLPVKKDLIMELLAKSRSALNEITNPCFVHWDLWSGNVFVNKENGIWEVEGIIDFERSFWGDPLTDCSLRGKKKNRNLWKAHGEKLLENLNAKIRDAWYDVYLGLLMHIESYVRQYSLLMRIAFWFYTRRLWKPAFKYLTKAMS